MSGQPFAGAAPSATSIGLAPSADVPTRAFVIELARAMQAVVERQRETTKAEVDTTTSDHLERVRWRAAAEAEELRRMAQQDIDAIKAWQEAEAERIRAEAAQRIADRGEALDGHLARHATLIGSEVDQIERVVADYQRQLGDYFDRLMSESNPVMIARLADQMPEPPDLAQIGGDARADALATVSAEPWADTSGPATAAPELESESDSGPATADPELESESDATSGPPAAESELGPESDASSGPATAESELGPESDASSGPAAAEPELESESDATSGPAAAGPELVPVMDPATATAASAAAGASRNGDGSAGADATAGPNQGHGINGAVGDRQEHAKPASRLLRFIVTLAAPTTAVKPADTADGGVTGLASSATTKTSAESHGT
jgi:hypothetical protein